MGIIALIFSILSSIPGIINLIKQIVDLIHGKSGAARAAAEHKFHDILRKHKDCNDHAGCQADLEHFKSELENGPQA